MSIFDSGAGEIWTYFFTTRRFWDTIVSYQLGRDVGVHVEKLVHGCREFLGD